MILKESCSSSKKQSKRQKKMATNEEKCPLCLEILEMDDLNFYPCKCGYQVCRFCWHRIRTNENGLCPACRRQYSEDPANFKPLSQEELQKLKNEKKMKEIQKKKEIAENRKQLANIRVVQKNLVFVHGLPLGIDAEDDRFRKVLHIFKEYGPVVKCVINNRTNYAGSQSPRASAYVTYQRIEDALKAYKSLPHSKIEGHDIRTSLGTTKYCSNFLKNVHCPKQDCMYLHEIADDELCFTKEQIHAGDHLEYGNHLYDRMMYHYQQKAAQSNHQHQKEPTPTLETEVHSKPNPEKVKLKEDSCGSSEESNNSPVQSRLQHLFSNREAQSPTYRAEHETQFACRFNSSPPSVKNSRKNGPSNDHRNLLSEETATTVNNVHNGTNYHNFPRDSQALLNGDVWREHREALTGQSKIIHNNHIPNGLQTDYNLLSTGNSTSSILSRLSLSPSNSGVNNSAKIESPSENDDDLGFDPCKVSLKGLADLCNAEDKESTRIDAVHKNTFSEFQKRLALQGQHPTLALMRLRNLHQQQQRQRNTPPPGFSANSFSSNQPLHSPVYESRTILPNRISPVVNMSNSYNVARPNFPLPQLSRYQPGGLAHNNNSLVNGFSSQPVRNVSQHQTLPLQAQAMHELLQRSTTNSPLIQSQRSENLTQPQFTTVDQNLSPSFWNMNQPQWMSPESTFQNQTVTDFRPASPLLNMRRMQQQQLRSNDINRQIQQLVPRYNNLSPFSDNPQYMLPNNNQHNQLTKGVHTFP